MSDCQLCEGIGLVWRGGPCSGSMVKCPRCDEHKKVTGFTGFTDDEQAAILRVEAGT